MNPIRVQLRRTKGWRMPPNTIRVCRPTKWGNPFKVECLNGVWMVSLLGDQRQRTVEATLRHMEASDEARATASRLRQAMSDVHRLEQDTPTIDFVLDRCCELLEEKYNGRRTK